MAKSKGIAYKDMTTAQQKLAEKISRKWGIPVEKVPMTKSGLVIINRKDCLHLSDVDYNLVREGLHWDEITDEHREEYLESLKDLPSKEEMEHVKKTFASLR
jgi:uncharacterized protein (DUF2147 family)